MNQDQNKLVPIIVCIPYWSGDRNLMNDLCKLIVGMQGSDAFNLCHFLLVSRQDCGIDNTSLNLLNKKFKAWHYRSQSPLKGWPAGPNGMFGSTINFLHVSNAGYECMFWMEPDCVPMRPNWWLDLVHEWRNREIGKLVVGCMHQVDANPDSMHINGCALYDPMIARRLPFLATCDRTAWDYQHRKAICDYGQNTPLIQNRYKCRNMTEAVFEENRAVVHGVKDDSLIKLVASRHGVR